MKKILVSLLLISAVSVTPALANYFGPSASGTYLNIGSAPNPKPAPRIIQAAAPIEIPMYVNNVVPPAPLIMAETAPAPLILAEAPPPPPPAVRRFIVFFDFDKSNLTVEAQQVVGTAVMTARETGMARIIVTGHTDTVGTEHYNQALSERRAETVKTEIARLGINARDIETVGKSFSEPLVNTGLGVREPQNRRAVIDLGFAVTAALISNTE